MSLMTWAGLRSSPDFPEPVQVDYDIPDPATKETADATALVDQDGDGLPDDWETANHHNPEDPSDREADFDLDGVTAYQEYLFGKNPLGEWKVESVDVPSGWEGWSSTPGAISDSGEFIVNFYRFVEPEGFDQTLSVVFNPATGTWTEMAPAANPGDLHSVVGWDINESGEVLLERQLISGETQGLLRTGDGQIEALEDSQGQAIVARRINNHGDWIGRRVSDGQMFSRIDGELNAGPDQLWNTYAYSDINDLGEILGTFTDPVTGDGLSFLEYDGWIYTTGFPGSYPVYNPSYPLLNEVDSINFFGEFSGRVQQMLVPGSAQTFFYDGDYHLAGVDGEISGVFPAGVDDHGRLLLRFPAGVFCDGIGVPVTDFGNELEDSSLIACSMNRHGAFVARGMQTGTIYHFSPDQDEDDDGMSDDWEDINGLKKDKRDDASLDPDGDGTSNLGEYRLGTNPHAGPAFDDEGGEIDLRPGIDTDGDGIPNVWEWRNGLDFLDPADAALDFDRDGYDNLQEFRLNTDPRGAPSYRLREVGPAPAGMTVSWSGAALGGDLSDNRLLVWGTPAVPATDGGARPAYWMAVDGEDGGTYHLYPSHGSQTTSLLARNPTGAVAAIHSSSPATLVYWASSSAAPSSIPGTNDANGSNTRSMSSCTLSPDGSYLAGRRTIHSTGAGASFIWRMPAPGQGFTTKPVDLAIPAGTTLSSSATLHVNDHGVVVANVTVSGATRVMKWQISPDGLSTTATLLPNLTGGTSSSVLGLSDSATPVIAGGGNKTGGVTTALAWDPSGAVAEVGLSGSLGSTVTGVSPGGAISGTSQIPVAGGAPMPCSFTGRYDAVEPGWNLTRQGEPCNLISHSSVNDEGEVLGTSRLASFGAFTPTLWRHGKAYPLELALSSGYVLESVSLLNERGALFGNAVRNGISVRILLTPDTDTDSDGMTDAFENSNGLEAYQAADGLDDPDEDGLTNLAEYRNGTDPHDIDTDSDGMNDKWEVDWGLLPLDAGDADADPDGDRVSKRLRVCLGDLAHGSLSRGYDTAHRRRLFVECQRRWFLPHLRAILDCGFLRRSLCLRVGLRLARAMGAGGSEGGCAGSAGELY